MRHRFFPYIMQQTRLQIDSEYQIKSAAKYWSSTRKKTFFFSRNGGWEHVNCNPIITCANKVMSIFFCCRFTRYCCMSVCWHNIPHCSKNLKVELYFYRHSQSKPSLRTYPNCQTISILICFQKFREITLLEVSQFFCCNYLGMVHTCVEPKIWKQTTKHSLISIQTVFDMKLTSQIDKLSCLCLEVWQKCNVNIPCNIIVQPFEDCEYLNGREIWESNGRISMLNVQSPNVAKMKHTWTGWKRIFLRFKNKKLLISF